MGQEAAHLLSCLICGLKPLTEAAWSVQEVRADPLLGGLNLQNLCPFLKN